MPVIEQGNIELILAAVTAAAVLMQAFVLLGILLGVRKTSSIVLLKVEELRSTVTSLVNNANGVLDRIGPSVEGAAIDVADVARRLRVQAAEMEASTAEIMERVRHQTGRVDAMITSLLNGVDKAGEYVVETVNRPVRQFSGILASVKAIMESLRSPARPPREIRSTIDKKPVVEDKFV
jgi:hypothetical protein